MMKSRTIFALQIYLITAFFTSGAAAAWACDTTLSAGSDIQTAIDAANPGDLICLDAGTYSPAAKININKSVTLQGPQADVDPRPSAGTTRVPGDTNTEAIIDGTGLSGVIVIAADNVVLNGLEVLGTSGDMIDSDSPTTGVTLKYNILRDAGDEAIQLRTSTDAVIEYNHVYSIAQDGINVCCSSTGALIQYNEVHDNNSENGAIYIYGSTATTIQHNLVYDVFGNDGIKMGTKGGDDAANPGGDILNNIVHDTVQDGISVYMSDTVVDGNEVYNSTSENGAIYVAFGVSNVDITNNCVHDNNLDAGKWGDPGAIMIGTAPDASTILVQENDIVGNSPNGVTNKATAMLDAEDNWWGAIDGPGGSGPGSGDAVSTNVDYDPFLVASIACVTCTPGVIDFESFNSGDQGSRLGVDLPDAYDGLDWAYDASSKINSWGSFTVQDAGAAGGNNSDGTSIPGAGGSDNWLKARAGAVGKGAKITRLPGECFEFKSMKLYTQDHPAFIDVVDVTWRTCDAVTTASTTVPLTDDTWIGVTAADLGIEGVLLRAMWFNGAPVNPNAAKFGLDDYEVCIVPEPDE